MTSISPSTPIRLTFSKPVSDVLGSRHPSLSPSTPGHWREPDSHTLVFTPSGFGAPLGSQLQMQLPHAVSVTAAPAGRCTRPARWNGRCPPARRCAFSSSSRSSATCRSTGNRRALPWLDAAPRRSRGRAPKRQLRLALPEHAAPAAGAVDAGPVERRSPAAR